MWKYNRMIDKIRRCGFFCIRWRYLIALIVFGFCVIFKLHGSSIAEYNELFENTAEYNNESLVFGESRWLRSDEWMLHTPYYMSQTYNGFEKDSKMMSIEGQDMIVGFNAPVVDVTLIAKPFTWGYVLLGDEYGLSWYWCSKMILLILVSFELCMIVTQKNKKVSVLGTLMIVLSPVVQWWFVPHVVDVFFWGMAILVLAYHFFTAEKRWCKNLFMVLLPLCVITFVLALFPSLQVPIALADIVLLVAFLIRDKKRITFKKIDVWRIVGMAVFALGVLGYTILTSFEAIKTLSNTVYPGSRMVLGGDGVMEDLFTDLTSFALPFKDLTYSNNSEASTFIQFAPLLLMLYPIIYKKMKRNKNIIVGNALVISIAVMIVFMLAGFPELLAKLTAFSYANRMKIVYGFVATIFTIWGIDMIWRKKIFSKKQIIGALAIYGFLYVCFVGENDLEYLSWKKYLMIIAIIIMLGYLMLARCRKMFLVGMTIVMIMVGGTVNPIARGTAALFKHPLEQKIREIAEEDPEAYWVTMGNIRLAPIGIANGARVLNMTNFYPDYGKWELIDPEKKYDKIYNRYAHINVEITDDEMEIELAGSPDAIKVKMDYETLKKWPVKYLLTTKELSKQKIYEKIYDDSEGEYYIYRKK